MPASAIAPNKPGRMRRCGNELRNFMGVFSGLTCRRFCDPDRGGGVFYTGFHRTTKSYTERILCVRNEFRGRLQGLFCSGKGGGKPKLRSCLVDTVLGI